jgi:CDP-diacylglycerol---glycerol-3-phosphate 3-phosphatidyltransferase
MFNFPNLLSLLRIPLALVFLQPHPLYRALAILGAMLTDCMDGFIARRSGKSTRIGTLLDPIMDKFFVFFVLTIFIQEQRLSWLEACLFICRDFSVILYGFFLAITGRLASYRFRAIWCGKITTALQFLTLLALSLHLVFSSFIYTLFLFLGLLALLELYQTDEVPQPTP